MLCYRINKTKIKKNSGKSEKVSLMYKIESNVHKKGHFENMQKGGLI